MGIVVGLQSFLWKENCTVYQFDVYTSKHKTAAMVYGPYLCLLVVCLMSSLGYVESNCKRVDVNNKHDCVQGITIYREGISAYNCPNRVDKSNWLTKGEDHLADTFGITQKGNTLIVKRIDDGGFMWCMGLSFKCCK